MGPTRCLSTDVKSEILRCSVSPTRYGTIVDAEAAKASETAMGSEFDGLSLYEKKVLLVNREIDAQGMGRYQWSVFFTCGAGYLLDLLWAQAFGLVVTPMQNEFGFGDEDLGTIFTAFSVGLTAGAFLWGILVDTIGRSAGFNYTVLISSIFGVWLGGSSNYRTVVVLTALTGIGIGGNIPVDTTICLECLPQSRRWLLPTLSIFQPIGVVACSAMAYTFIPKYSCVSEVACSTAGAGVQCCSTEDNWGWRYLMFTIGGITIAVFILRSLLFTFQESPKYLLYRGRDEEAINVLQYIARFNKRECSLTWETFNALSSDTSHYNAHNSGPLLGTGADKKDLSMVEMIQGELARFKPLFSSFAMARLVILVWVIYAFDYWGFTIAGSFLPTILARKGRDLGLGLHETYRSYIYIYSFGIPGVLAGSLIYGRRRTALLLSSALFGACLFAFTLVSDQASYIAINGLVYFFQSMFNGVLYGWTPEAFPAQVRGSACGISSFFGRLIGIVAPIAGSHMLAHSLNGVLYLAGAGVWVCTVAILLLPKKSLQGQNH